MTPVIPLAVFCLFMSFFAVAKLALADDRERTDVGTTLLVVGITALVLAWVDLERRPGAEAVGLSLAAAGVGLSCAGVALVAREW